MGLDHFGEDDEGLSEGTPLINDENEGLSELKMPIKGRSYLERELIAMGFKKDIEYGNHVFFVRETDGCDMACVKNGSLFNVFSLGKK